MSDGTANDGRRPALNAEGLATRRKVLGDAYVDAAIAKADAFSWPLQQIVTEQAWNAIWNRPGLPLRTRSLVIIGMLVALNRPHELRIHLRGALNNGCTPEEIREVLIQATGYCGFPAGVDGFRVAAEVIAEHQAASDG
jgi:4-carboxymuconolactone decarboxylase